MKRADKDVILMRRRRFVAAALASGFGVAALDCGPKKPVEPPRPCLSEPDPHVCLSPPQPEPCLDVAPPPEPQPCLEQLPPEACLSVEPVPEPNPGAAGEGGSSATIATDPKT